MSVTPKLSVVIPVYNEEAVLPTLFSRLYPTLDALGIAYEVVFINDGSKDKSVALLRQQFGARPRHTRIVLFHANFGQHSAVMAGLAYARGEYVVTLDADLQNPPEEIRATTMSAPFASSARTRSGGAGSPNASTSCASGSRRCASPIRAA
jgi:undecaprenyl-phosphate 4-deoxy-4-formamido-L-arabinose transferase